MFGVLAAENIIQSEPESQIENRFSYQKAIEFSQILHYYDFSKFYVS